MHQGVSLRAAHSRCASFCINCPAQGTLRENTFQRGHRRLLDLVATEGQFSSGLECLGVLEVVRDPPDPEIVNELSNPVHTPSAESNLE